jgi:hypothetical protein
VKRWEAWINHAGWILTAASGLLYGVLKYFVAGSDPDSRLAHPWQPTVLALHVLAAPVAVFGFGLLFRRHALAQFSTASERRLSGTVVMLVSVPLILSGYVLQTLTGQAARRWIGWGHALLGLLYAVGYALHPFPSRLPENAAETAAQSKNRLP